ncbi:CoA transferase [Anaeromyxobacter paludicola]|uniref:CoA transferase n=1 Tax=Anaeromyxobacter paludicola TaxID=2918171 RepID=A0ABN6N2V8_9BACT|nr:CoA transferase [Anaeromyxobacter paludicola]
MLADLGADVVKLEDPDGGDYLRALPPLAGAESGYFHALNRNKRSLALDLGAPGGAAAFLKLARTFDVVVESFRPGVLDRLGCGWEALRAASPAAILCSITGYGQTGPYRDLAGHDLDYCALAGVLARNGPPEAPLPLGVPVADLAGGAWPAVAGILAALHRRQASGVGARVDVSMTEGALSLLALAHGGAAAGEPLGRGEGGLDGRRACYGVYRAADGRFVALAALEPRFFRRFCEAVGRPELAARQLDGDGPRAELEAVFAARTRDEWAAFGREHDVCLAPVLEPAESREDPQLRARGAFLEVPTPREGRAMPGVATPVRLDGATAPLRPAPRLGEHGDEVLREAGFDPEEVASLRAAGALAPSSA